MAQDPEVPLVVSEVNRTRPRRPKEHREPELHDDGGDAGAAPARRRGPRPQAALRVELPGRLRFGAQGSVQELIRRTKSGVEQDLAASPSTVAQSRCRIPRCTSRRSPSTWSLRFDRRGRNGGDRRASSATSRAASSTSRISRCRAPASPSSQGTPSRSTPSSPGRSRPRAHRNPRRCARRAGRRGADAARGGRSRRVLVGRIRQDQAVDDGRGLVLVVSATICARARPSTRSRSPRSSRANSGTTSPVRSSASGSNSAWANPRSP